jgi:hypothetical protein
MPVFLHDAFDAARNCLIHAKNSVTQSGDFTQKYNSADVPCPSPASVASSTNMRAPSHNAGNKRSFIHRSFSTQSNPSEKSSPAALPSSHPAFCWLRFVVNTKAGQGVGTSPMYTSSRVSNQGFVVNTSHMNASKSPAATPVRPTQEQSVLNIIYYWIVQGKLPARRPLKSLATTNFRLSEGRLFTIQQY